MKICNLASGSKGNCTYIESEHAKILVDVGVSLSYVENCLKGLDVLPEDIDAIIISHEHSDHTKGIKHFAKKYSTEIFCDENLYSTIVSDIIGAGHNLIGFNGDFFVADLHIYPIKLPHDSISCHGFLIIEGNAVVSIITDLGYMPENVLDIIKSSNLIYLESNYDERMLFACATYPDWLKRRIKSKSGHLSNDDCAKTIEILAQNQVKNVVLSHISESSNTEELALNNCLDYLARKNIIVGRDITIDVAHQNRPSTIYKIKPN